MTWPKSSSGRTKERIPVMPQSCGSSGPQARDSPNLRVRSRPLPPAAGHSLTILQPAGCQQPPRPEVSCHCRLPLAAKKSQQQRWGVAGSGWKRGGRGQIAAAPDSNSIPWLSLSLVSIGTARPGVREWKFPYLKETSTASPPPL